MGGVGDYWILASGLDATDYSITYVPGILHVIPAPLTVRANDLSRWYGANNPALTATFIGLVSSETPDQFSGLTLNTSATGTSPVGIYAISASGLVAPNYRTRLCRRDADRSPFSGPPSEGSGLMNAAAKTAGAW